MGLASVLGLQQQPSQSPLTKANGEGEGSGSWRKVSWAARVARAGGKTLVRMARSQQTHRAFVPGTAQRALHLLTENYLDHPHFRKW